MNNKERAHFLFKEAEETFKEALKAYEANSWNRTIRRAQETVELSLKALFKLLGIEYPKVHDVAPILEKVLKRKNIGIDQNTMDKIKLTSKQLTEKRAPALYGEVMYSKEEAKEALKGAEEILNFARHLKTKMS